MLSSAISMAADSSTWIILNGDVEPEWAEALNSALDDNRLLTLPSGVGIRLGSGLRCAVDCFTIPKILLNEIFDA